MNTKRFSRVLLLIVQEQFLKAFLPNTEFHKSFQLILCDMYLVIYVTFKIQVFPVSRSEIGKGKTREQIG